MNVKQSYFDFLAAQGAKQKVQAIIEHDINEWKKAQAWYYEADDNAPGDYSGHCHMNGDKTIGDICKTDMDVLKAYTGDSQATYTSGCGLHWMRVAERISRNINDCISQIRSQFISENADALFEEYDIEHDADWTEDDIFLTLDEAMTQNDYGLNFEWMQQEFPEYILIDDEDLPARDYMFDINE